MNRATTDNEQTLAALRVAESHLRKIIEHSSNLFYMHTPEHVLTYVSPQSRQFFDCEPGEALVPWTEFITDNPVNRGAIEATQRAIDSGERQPPYQVECIGRRGRKIWVEVNETPIVENGKTVAMVGSLTDITERKQAVEQIARLNADMAERAAELERANRELEAFNYTVAHDLRKPLTTISGYCQLLMELCRSRLDERCNNCLREIFDSTWQMNDLIDTLLAFSQLTHAELTLEKIDLAEIARQIVSELQQSEPARKATFHIAAAAPVEGDADLLRAALTNLLGNAWKYTVNCEESVIAFGLTEIAGESACFVRDNGIGFNMEDATKLFTPFQRFANPSICNGFGIGLATVERIVHRHGGRVWAEGEPGRGATFYFTIGGS